MKCELWFVYWNAKIRWYLSVDNWDTKTYEYKIAKSSKKLIDLNQYIFVIRQRIDTFDDMCTSFFLWWWLKQENDKFYMLYWYQIRKITKHFENNFAKRSNHQFARKQINDTIFFKFNYWNLLTLIRIEQNLLYNYIDELKSYQSNANADITRNNNCFKHLNFLIDFFKIFYKSIVQRFFSLLQKNEIIYDLLWAFFKSISLIYTICFETNMSRCVLFDNDEKKKTNFEIKYYNMKCRYLNYND